MRAYKTTPYASSVWRAVERQAKSTTRVLAASLADHDLLEAALEDHKPPIPPEAVRLHWLATTPFRYRRAYESRFGALNRPGIWYGAESTDTALRECLYHRLTFFSAYDGAQPLSFQGTLVMGNIDTPACLDITGPAFHRQRAALESRTDYSACQALAERARDQSVHVIRYNSARTPKTERGRACVAVLSPLGFGEPAIVETEQRSFHAHRDARYARVELLGRPPLQLEIAGVV